MTASEEVEIYNRISEIDPADAEAVRLGKDASARASMTSGGWTQAESYRDLIKDKEAAVSLEQQSRMQLSGESLEQQIAEMLREARGRAAKCRFRPTARRSERAKGRSGSRRLPGINTRPI